MDKTPARQRKEGRDPKGGLNAKGRASYDKANPGKPRLKPPQPQHERHKEKQMGKMYIRVKKDGFIYDYNEYLARNPECEVVPEEIAYPERFVPPHAAVRIADAKKAVKTATRKTKAVLDLSTADIPEAPPYTSPELAEEAARGMP